MKIVVDANVAIKWSIIEDLRDQARRLPQFSESLHAPDLLISEATNVAWKKVIRNEITSAQAHEVLKDLREAELIIHSASDLAPRALQMALQLNHSVYDCFYLACAEIENAILVTADRRLCQTIQDTESAPLVRFLGDPDFLQELEV